MAMSIVLAIIAFANLLTGLGSDAALLTINPQKCIAAMQNEVHISCEPGTDEDRSNDIALIQLSRNGEDPMVFLRDCSNITYGGNWSGRIQAEATISKAPGQTYLNVTLWNPMSHDTGIYTCTVLYVDRNGNPKQAFASSNLVVEKLDVTSLESVLTSLANKMATMEDKLEKRITAMGENHEQRMTELNDKVTFTSAFSATNWNSRITTKNGQVLILPDIITQQGSAYDPNTGVYTAPKDGLYVFHVVVRAHPSSTYFDLDLMANDKLLSRLAANDDSHWDQSAISSVVDLKTGDRVFSMMRDGGYYLHESMYTVFTGYLIKAF